MNSLTRKNIIVNNWGLIRSTRMSKLTFNHLKMLAVLLLMGVTGVFISNPGLCGTTVGEEIISMDLSEQPLGEVLDDIAATTGYRFIFDDKWDNFLVSASIKNEPLHKGLKRILRNLNNVIIYSSNRTIKIIIFDEAVTSANQSRALVNRTPDDESVQRAYSLPARSLPRPLPANQETAAVEDDNRQSEAEEGSSTTAELDEAAPADGEPSENETGESAAQTTNTDGSEQTEDTPDSDEKSPEESSTDN